MPVSNSMSRRDFFRLPSGSDQQAPENTPMAPRAPAPTPSLAEHVAMRLMYGAKPGQVADIESAGVDYWIYSQLRPDSSDTAELSATLNSLPHSTLSESVTTLWDRTYADYTEAIRPVHEVRHATIARMLHSKWQLFEIMVEFWRDHFNVYGYDSPVRSLYPTWDKLLRQNALGNFRTLAEATSKHPAMLYFLDNYLSTNAGPNENFAREFFELHTLGAMHYNTPEGYIDEDVYESSRCFTGWTYDRDKQSPTRGQFKYIRDNHDRFQKVVLGKSIPRDQADMADGLQVLDFVCNHPGTARHIAYKLCKRFIAENPPDSIVDSTASVFLANVDTPNQILRTLEHIFDSTEFRDPANRGILFKRPYDWIISAMRALAIPYIYREGEDAFDFTGRISLVGYQLFSWRSPDGPSYDRYDWCSANSMLRRCNYVFQIDAGWWTKDGMVYPSVELMPSSLKSPRQITDWWIDRVFQRQVSDVTAECLLDFVARGRNPDLALSGEQITDTVPRLAALCTTSPEFMWR